MFALRRLLSTLHLRALDSFLEELPLGQFPAAALHCWEGFHAAVASPLYHLNDGAARGRVAALHEHWGGCLSFGQHFRPTPGHAKYVFRNPGDLRLNERQQEDWDRMQAQCEAMRRALDELLAHVRAEYVEVDLEAASEAAWREFVRFNAQPAPKVGD